MTISLDPIRDDLITWAESLWLEGYGAFRNGVSNEPSLKSSLFITYILYSIDALDTVRCDRTRWAAWIQAQQNEQDGSFALPLSPESSQPRHGHARWNAVRVLNILGGEVLHFPAHQQEAMTVDGLRVWFEAWKSSDNTHHEVLALVPTLVSHPDSMWVETFFKELADQQHPSRGTWPRDPDTTNISRTFAYSLIYMGLDRLPPQAEKIVDAMLNLQDADGFWH